MQQLRRVHLFGIEWDRIAAAAAIGARGDAFRGRRCRCGGGRWRRCCGSLEEREAVCGGMRHSPRVCVTTSQSRCQGRCNQDRTHAPHLGVPRRPLRLPPTDLLDQLRLRDRVHAVGDLNLQDAATGLLLSGGELRLALQVAQPDRGLELDPVLGGVGKSVAKAVPAKRRRVGGREKGRTCEEEEGEGGGRGEWSGRWRWRRKWR